MKALQAELAELKKKMSTMASLGQVVHSQSSRGRRRSPSSTDDFLFGASGEVLAAVATRAQTIAQTGSPPTVPVDTVSRPRHAGLPDQIDQSRLPLSFGVAETSIPRQSPTPTSLSVDVSTRGDAAHSLAYKVLRLPVFAGVDFLTPDFQPSSVFHLAGSMLEGKVSMPSLEVSQAVTAPPTEEELVAMRAKLAAEAISIFEANSTFTRPI